MQISGAMRSKLISLKVPWPVLDAMQEICVEDEYGNMHECIIAALIEKVLTHRRRRFVKSIAAANPKTQDYLLEKTLTFPMDALEAMEWFTKVE